jgi:hypothetical protein
MAWIISCSFPRIQSYKEAVKVWHQAVVFPRSPLGPRGLVDRRKKHLTIEQTEAKDIVLRLYQHPVVTWHKDNSLTICPYSSRSTTKFGNHCTPSGMYVGYSSVSIGGLHYKVKDKLTFRQRDGKWKVADRNQITPWSVSVVNRERAKQALREAGYEEFRAWFKVYIQMAAKPDGQAGWIDNTNIVTMLRDRKWRDLVACRFLNSWSHPDQVLHEIRQAVYRECDCIDKKSVPFLG